MAGASSNIRWFVIFWIFVMGAFTYFDRVNISIGQLLTPCIADRFGWTVSFLLAAALTAAGAAAGTFIDLERESWLMLAELLNGTAATGAVRHHRAVPLNGVTDMLACKLRRLEEICPRV